MRNKIINYFLGEPEEISTGSEISFYLIMGMPIGMVLITFLFVLL